MNDGEPWWIQFNEQEPVITVHAPGNCNGLDSEQNVLRVSLDRQLLLHSARCGGTLDSFPRIKPLDLRDVGESHTHLVGVILTLGASFPSPGTPGEGWGGGSSSKRR